MYAKVTWKRVATFASPLNHLANFHFLAEVTSANPSHSAMLMISSSYPGPYSSQEGNQPSYFALLWDSPLDG